MGDERMVVLTGDLADHDFALESPITIGRNPDNTIQLEDLQVSRKHALIERTAKGTILRDLGSGNGTFVEGRRVLEYKLNHGDVVRIGSQDLRYEAGKPDGAVGEPGSGVRFNSGPVTGIEATNADQVYQTLFQAPDAAASDEQLRETQKRLQAIYHANEIITSERNLNKLFERIMDQIFSLVPAHNGVILLREEETDEWVQEHMKAGTEGEDIAVSSTIVNRAFDNGEAVLTMDAADDSRFETGASIITQNISSAMCVPLRHQDDRLGVVYVDTRGTANAFEPSDVELLVAIAGPASVAIKNAQYLRTIEQSYEDTLLVLANAIELRDHYTVGHTWRVTNVSVEMARELGWDDEKLKEVEMGVVLHDVGKIAVDNAILGKTSRLTEEEYEKMKVHPQRGAELLQDVVFLKPFIPYCLYHHERYDGKGYPFGMSGEDIPVEGRLVAVADTFDAMTSNRPYRKGLDPEIAIAEIEKGKGSQFDPACADALIRCFRDGKVDQVLQDYHKTDERSIACPFCSTFLRVPEDIAEGGEFQCHVCRRHIRLVMQNQAYYGEQIPQSMATGPVPTTTHRQTEASRDS